MLNLIPNHLAFLIITSYMFTLLLVCLLLSTVFIVKGVPYSLSKEKNPRACKKIGRQRNSGIELWVGIRRSILDVLWHRSQGKQGPTLGVVESLFVHPIKSCRALEVAEAEISSTGFKYDRQYSFAEFRECTEGETPSATSQTSGWHFVTQRKYGKLASIRVEVWMPDPDSLDYTPGEPNVQSDGILLVRYPAMDERTGKYETQKSFELPFNPTRGQIMNQGYTMQKMTIWKDCPDGLLITSTDRADSPPWIKDIQAYIGCSKPFALFRVATGHERQVFRNAPRKEQLGYQSVVGFADAYPLHILGLASVEDLDRRLTHVVPDFPTSTASRFRANIYFNGPPAYAEDSWKRIKIGQHMYYVPCRTTRCELPNTDQSTGKKHLSEPSKTIRGYRDIDPGAGPGKACMGMQMVPADEKAMIKIGDKIEVLEIGHHYYIQQ
ncbi:MAG: hypothetical protein L6R41_005059 [Letrouitia leprolyta]|nr:MAG: hypothetical protein L6R41_005059 [Letrouitia leprolyta]